MNKGHTCCFTGHRKLSKDKIDEIIKRLDHEIDNLMNQGVTDFISGGALGFDQIAASLVIAKRKMSCDIRLIFALPCRNQDKKWSNEQKRLYCDLLTEADEIIYVSKNYYDGCMEKRNRYMVERSTYCICALLYPRSGTGQTVRYAREEEVCVVNVAGQITKII